MTHIISIKAYNIKGLKNAEIALNGKGATVAGKNGQGKSSLLDCIKMALAGSKAIPQNAVRAGEESGEIILEMDKFTVKRFIDSTGRTQLKVESAEGAQFRSPQTMLDELFGNLAFDPGKFRSMDPKKRIEILRDAGRIDFSELDKTFKETYEERTEIGREIKTKKGKLEGRRLHKDAPAAEESVTAIAAELEKAQQHNTTIEGLRAEYRQKQARQAQQQAELVDVQQQIAALKKKEESLECEIKGREKEMAALVERAKEATEIDLAPIRERMANVESINQKVRENAETRALKAELDDLEVRQSACTAQLEDIEAEKARILRDADLPMPGLGFDEVDVTYEGRAWEVLAESEQWQVSLALGFALNPRGIVIMRESGGLDAESRAAIHARAAALGIQLLLEVPDRPADAQIIIEAGEVIENRFEQAQGVAA